MLVSILLLGSVNFSYVSSIDVDDNTSSFRDDIYLYYFIFSVHFVKAVLSFALAISGIRASRVTKTYILFFLRRKLHLLRRGILNVHY